jgi:hypothetical protein
VLGVSPALLEALWEAIEGLKDALHYAHLGEIRHRSEVVENRVEQHLERIGDRRTKKSAPHHHESDSGAEAWAAWAMRGSNPRPRACEARALTS